MREWRKVFTENRVALPRGGAFKDLEVVLWLSYRVRPERNERDNPRARSNRTFILGTEGL